MTHNIITECSFSMLDNQNNLQELALYAPLDLVSKNPSIDYFNGLDFGTIDKINDKEKQIALNYILKTEGNVIDILNSLKDLIKQDTTLLPSQKNITPFQINQGLTKIESVLLFEKEYRKIKTEENERALKRAKISKEEYCKNSPCANKPWRSQLCKKHYNMDRCKVKDCKGHKKYNDMCKTHYYASDECKCSFQDCNSKQIFNIKHSLCKKHYHTLYRNKREKISGT